MRTSEDRPPPTDAAICRGGLFLPASWGCSASSTAVGEVALLLPCAFSGAWHRLSPWAVAVVVMAMGQAAAVEVVAASRVAGACVVDRALWRWEGEGEGRHPLSPSTSMLAGSSGPSTIFLYFSSQAHRQRKEPFEPRALPRKGSYEWKLEESHITNRILVHPLRRKNPS